MLATRIGMLPGAGKVVRTLDTGGAGPITALLEADRMIRQQVMFLRVCFEAPRFHPYVTFLVL